MNFTSFYVLFISTLASFALALPLHAARDVYAPPVTSPAAGTEWVVNSTQTVTWDVSSPPEQITNRFHSSLRLRKGDRTTPLVLADDFDILLGQIDITVPWVTQGDDYVVVLFGDSGNWSPAFTITGGPEY